MGRVLSQYNMGRVSPSARNSTHNHGYFSGHGRELFMTSRRFVVERAGAQKRVFFYLLDGFSFALSGCSPIIGACFSSSVLLLLPHDACFAATGMPFPVTQLAARFPIFRALQQGRH